MSTAKEKFLKVNTLACLVGQCVGHVTTVELRNEAFVSGKVVHVDGFMNVTLEKAKFTDPCGNRRTFDQFYVQCRLIRGVQIPSRIDMRQALVQSVQPRSREKLQISRQRQSILKKREAKRLEDLQNATANLSKKC